MRRGTAEDIATLRELIRHTEDNLKELKDELVEMEENASNDSSSFPTNQTTTGKPLDDTIPPPNDCDEWKWPLLADEYLRYGRQMIMPEIGLRGQLNLRAASVLVVGVGGLGCPAATYLAGAGVGTIGLVDGDSVELSNLHRQILHTTARVGQLKVDSAVAGLRQLNPRVRYVTHPEHLSPTTALTLFEPYDLILDCTDHPTSRYLISDAAVLSGKSLVSASALRTEGQLIVLNNPPRSEDGPSSGPCYRCIFPKPPPVDSVVGCGEGGILGPVVGVMGVLMALEAIKIIASRKPDNARAEETPASMLIFSAYGIPSFRTVRLRGKRSKCITCGFKRELTKESLDLGSLDYALFCGIASPINVLSAEHRITATQLQALQEQEGKDYVLLDVRDETQFGLCSLPNTINLPVSTLESIHSGERRLVEDNLSENEVRTLGLLDTVTTNKPIYTICRFGNDSQIAVQKLRELGYDQGGKRWIGDIQGGFKAWKKDVDPTWPDY